MGDEYNVLSLHTILLISSLAIFGLQMVIIITSSNKEEPQKIKTSVLQDTKIDEHFDYNSENENECLENFINDLESEVKSFNKIQKLSKAPSATSMCLSPILAIYDFCVCNCEFNFYSISFVIPIYELITILY